MKIERSEETDSWKIARAELYEQARLVRAKIGAFIRYLKQAPKP
ncbi:MAG TPA: hypothetical protein VL171_04465 [Verrucomicrobiae bacterium]|nr:hypothetical protein [Verrucomicrobiae bacterium]